MSAADSEEPPPPPPLSQLWPGFGSTTSELNIGLSGSNIFDAGSNGGDVNSTHNFHSNLGLSNLASKGRTNDNYVNFNQFIEQHNLMGTTGVRVNVSGGGGSGDSDGVGDNDRGAFSLMDATSHEAAHNPSPNADDALFCLKQKSNNNPSIHNVYNARGASFFQQPNRFCSTGSDRGDGDGGGGTGPNVPFDFSFNQHSAVNSLFSDDMSLYGPTNNGLQNVAHSGGSLAQIDDNIYKASPLNNGHDYDNLYTPFSNNGTTYYANPFATGFDFTSTKLQPSAPEFVPRFDQLSINDNNTQINIIENTTQSSTKEEIDEDGLKLKINQEDKEKNATYSPCVDGGGEQRKEQIDQFQRIFKNNDRDVTQPNNKSVNNFNHNQHHKKSYNRLEKNMERFSRHFVDNKKLNDSSSNSNSSSTSAAGCSTVTTKQNSAESKQNENHREGGDNHQNNSNYSHNSNYNHYNHYSNHNHNNYNYNHNSHNYNNYNNYNYSYNYNNNHNYNNYNNNNIRRAQNGRNGGSVMVGINNTQDYSREEQRFDRYLERGEPRERGNFNGGSRYNRERDYHQRFDNYRSNKRRDDWNRNRDRVVGYRVEEKFSFDGSRESPLQTPEKKPISNGYNYNSNTNTGAGASPKKFYAENEKLSQREKLMRDIEIRRLECLVCVEPIKAHQAVWSCYNCYHILHLQCIIKWASSSKSEDGWRCPACQNVEKDVPHDYYCFCGKVKNPPNNRLDLAHSCGEVCGRVEGCQHACTLLCHPGPCPPCQANVKRACGCGRTTKTMQCCLKETIDCDAVCAKMLNCEVHECNEKCHLGKCPPCKEKVAQTCHCAKQEREVVCTRDSHGKLVYSCGKPCGKELSCGNHKCKDCCHAGECRTCKLSPEVIGSCPCGKLDLVPGERTSCLDPVPVCEGVCGKTLRCGKATHPHHCTSKCHLGQCPPCNKQTAVKCRCGHMDQMIKCRQLSTRADDARCKKRCVKKRSCGKHKCNQECCIDIDHVCPLPCTYTLSCGKHKCDQPCHRGNCPPCYRSSFDELFCECGAEVIYPPVPCGTKRPLCKRPCSRKHPCDHPPQHNCHSASNCPPCMIFTTQWCYGQHEQRKTIPCSQQSFSCGMFCNKPLPCGRHKCIKTCHEGACQVAGDTCKQSCPTLRSSCGHKCMAPCHDGDCPETQCKEMVEVQCECGHRKQMRPCHELAREYSRIATAQLASSMAEMQRGNYMELSEILAPIKLTNKTNKTLDCNEECRTLERNRRLTIGLQVRNPDLPQKLMTKYSDFIRNFAKRDPTLVKSVHEALTTLVKLAKESKQRSRSHSFPTMNREKRQLVHEMCEMFGVESVAYDAEPNRNVVATAYKDRSWLPATSIMEVLQRESGQRRVPVPSNNAWGSKR